MTKLKTIKLFEEQKTGNFLTNSPKRGRVKGEHLKNKIPFNVKLTKKND